MMIFDVRQFGAMGDGVTDDTDAIEKAIKAASQEYLSTDRWGKGGIVYHPAGVYRISRTLTINRQSGIQLIGAGAFPGDERNASNVLGPRASLVWDGSGGSPPPPMLHFTGCSGITVSDLGLYGSDDPEDQFPQVTLIKFDDAGGWGAGTSTFRNLTLVAAELGIEIGVVDQNNAADIVFERMTFVKLKTGFRVPHEQGVNYRWNMLYAKACPTVMNLGLGGCVNLDTAEIDGCGDPGTGAWAFTFGTGGPNVRCSRLTCVRITGETKSFLKVAGDHRVAVDSFIEAQDAISTDDRLQVSIEGGAVTFHASSFQTPDSVTWQAGASSRRSILHYRDCWFNDHPNDVTGEFPVSNWITNPTDINCFYSIERCDGINNAPFKDDQTNW